MQDIQLCAALIYWNVVTMLEAAYFLTRWLLPWGRLEWNNIKQMLATTRLPQPYDEHLLGDGSDRISCMNMEILMLDFDQDFPIVTDQEEGSAADIHYNPQQHGDPLLYVQAFVEVLEMKAQGPI